MIEEVIIDKINDINNEYNILCETYKKDLNKINILTRQRNSMVNVLEEVLDEVKNYNQPDYKSAFEELENDISNSSTYSSLDINGEIIIRTYENLNSEIQEIKKKYKLGGE